MLWEKSAEFDGSRPFLPWAMRFAQLQAMAWLKRRQQQRLVFDDELVKLLADELAAEPVFEARWHALASCLQKLGSEHQALIARRYEPEASVKAMAEAAGTTPKAVSDKLRRIRRALLDGIQQTLAEESFAFQRSRRRQQAGDDRPHSQDSHRHQERFALGDFDRQ